jgi:ferredoxin-like protein FixX
MEYTLTIDVEKFRSTNAPWNNLMLNDPWSVGYVTTLIELVPFEKKEDWEKFYHESGQKREVEISKLISDLQHKLNDESLIRVNKNSVNQLSWDLKNLNTQYGRTKERLQKKGLILFNEVKNNGLGLTVEECIECVRYRVICETWNGVIVRERNTVQNLLKQFPTTEFKKVSGEMDHTFAVDYELYKNGVLTAAIQIKPQSYTWNAPYIQKARNANKHKNQEYFKKFGVQVYDIISDSRGNIINADVLKNL